MSVHSIRLAGPWERETSTGEISRVQLPCAVDSREHTACLRRKFHCPSGLTERSQVRIVLRVDGQIPVAQINNNSLRWEPCVTPTPDSVRTDVTAQLQSFNTLTVEADGRMFQLLEAHLEISESHDDCEAE